MNAHAPLEGIRVLAVENFIAGPIASMWLADAGAEVVKIERPAGGDQARGLPPFRERDGDRRSLSFVRANRNKRSLALDLKAPEGRELFLRLVDAADVVLENLNPTAMQRLGLSADVLRARNEELIYVSISGFGRVDSPLADRPAFDVVAQAMGGLMRRPESADERPAYLGFPATDLYAATLAVAGTYRALFRRERFGGGDHVDIALLDGAIALNELSLIMHSALGTVPKAGLHALTAPFGAYAARDGYLVIGVLGDATWWRFTEAIGRPDLRERPELADGIARHENHDVLLEAMRPWLEQHTVEQAVAVLSAHDVPAAPVHDVDDVARSEHARARGMLLDVEDPCWGTLTVAGNPIRSADQPVAPCEPAPGLGADTESVLESWLGIAEPSA